MPFVSIEGIDGSGKSTQVEMLVAELTARNLSVVRTKEPDGGWIGSGVRSILVSERPRPLSAQEEMLLISAARFDHVRSVIRPALADGCWVVSDRFVDSTYAFQAFESDALEHLFDGISREVVGETMPDFTFILDIDPNLARQRRRDSGRLTQSDPAEEVRDFARIRRGLLEAARRAPHRCQVIDGREHPEKVALQILTSLFRGEK